MTISTCRGGQPKLFPDVSKNFTSIFFLARSVFYDANTGTKTKKTTMTASATTTTTTMTASAATATRTA